MKGGVAPLIAAFLYEAFAYSDNQLANEVAFVKGVVNTQLQQDKAPDNLIKEEAHLFNQAEQAVQSKSSTPGRGTSFLANRERSSTEASQALAAKVSREVEFASKAVEIQLQQDHAPASLVQNEEGLLAKAAAAAQRAQHMLGKANAMKDHERGLKQKLQSMDKHNLSVVTEANAERELMLEEDKVAYEVSERLQDTEYVKKQAQKALEQSHVGIATQKQVDDLLAKAENAERSELALSQKSLSVASHQRLKLEVATTRPHGLKYTHGRMDALNSRLQKLETEAMSELKQMNASPNKQQRVNQLLNKLAKDNRKLTDVEKHLSRNTKKAKQVTYRKKNERTTWSEEQRLARLESQNAELRAQNTRLQAEHDMLIREEKLANENTFLDLQNHELQDSNSKMEEDITTRDGSNFGLL